MRLRQAGMRSRFASALRREQLSTRNLACLS
jgi:hypothetical protein